MCVAAHRPVWLLTFCGSSYSAAHMGMLAGGSPLCVATCVVCRRGVQKSILERGGPPSFDVAIEMLARTKWRVHLDVGQVCGAACCG